MTAPHVLEDLSLSALGMLDARERAAVERHLRECASCREALPREEDVAWTLAESVAREPPRDLRARIVARHRRAPAFAWRLAFAAALVAAIVSAGALVVTQAELAEERRLAGEYARALDEIAAGARVVPLEVRGGIRGAGALVVPISGDPYLVLALPAPPPGKVYEAWIIRGEQAPLPAGLAPAREGVVTVRLTVAARPGDVAAVTLEPEGGAQRPSGEPLLAGRL